MLISVDSFIRNWFYTFFTNFYRDTKFFVYSFNWRHIIKYLFLSFLDKHNSQCWNLSDIFCHYVRSIQIKIR